MPQRIRLLRRCVIGGSVREPGEIVSLPDGMVGPHRTVVSGSPDQSIASARYAGESDADAGYTQQYLADEPLFVVVDEEVEREREEMRERHAAELAEHHDDPQRDEIIHRQAKERGDLEFRSREKELDDKQKREAERLQKHQEAESKAFDKRAESSVVVPAPREIDKEALDNRHRSEAESLKERHERDRSQFEAGKPKAVASSEPGPTPDAERHDPPFEPMYDAAPPRPTP